MSQGIVSTKSGQGAPPGPEGVMTARWRSLKLAPHVELHTDQLLQAETTQSTAGPGDGCGVTTV